MATGRERGLFAGPVSRPLADRLRPRSLAEISGQDHLLGPDRLVGRMLARRALSSMILWGPPGCGKTTLARLLADATGYAYEDLPAVSSGVVELRRAFAQAAQRLAAGSGTVLFVDEIHRFNRTQQDTILPVMEDGTIVLIGATTENPSFALSAALLSRARVLVLNRLDAAALERLLIRAEQESGRSLPLDEPARETLCALADGDGRHLLNMVEDLQHLPATPLLDVPRLMELVQRRRPLHDKREDGHYNLLSALHKSLRASDADAALYWLARMLDGGEDPRVIARRLVRVAVEDVGLADPLALARALEAWQAYERLGTPEGELALAWLVLYLGTAPKSNAAYVAFQEAQASAAASGSLTPPSHALNAPTSLMRDLGYSQGYINDHDTVEGCSGLDYFPEQMDRRSFYHPTDHGFERDISHRLTYWRSLRQA